MSQVRQDEAKFYRPLSDLGIEFEKKETHINNIEKVQEERYPERIDTHIQHPDEVVRRPGIFSAIKKVFDKKASFSSPQPKNRQEYASTNNKFVNQTQKEKIKDNTALREILDKTLSENKIFSAPPADKEEKPKEKEAPSISLNELKNTQSAFNSTSKDRSASKEDMDKLKNFISTKSSSTESSKVVEEVKPASTKGFGEVREEIKKVEEIPIKKEEAPKTQNPVSSSGTIREVPEDVLKKILE
jgi:hypothetical protein